MLLVVDLGALVLHPLVKGPFKCYVTQMGVGGVRFSGKKALRRCNVQCY